MQKLYKRLIVIGIILLFFNNLNAQKVDYSVVSVPEESGIEFMQITSDGDYVCMPVVTRNRSKISWAANRIIDIAPNGNDIAYLSYRNNSSNIFIKALGKQGSSIQRTNRANITDFSFSPDGQNICFSETRGKNNQIFLTSAINGYVCRQITNGNLDYSPVYSLDMKHIFFARQEAKGISIWSHNIEDNFLSNYTTGMNPCYSYEKNIFFCTRINAEGRGEIWKINYEAGIEECIVSDTERSFTCPIISPNGKYLLIVGSSKITRGKYTYLNTDIYVAHADGTNLQQITYHAADDLSPVWSKDGKYIYFISQRGSAESIANIWRMTFNNF